MFRDPGRDRCLRRVLCGLLFLSALGAWAALSQASGSYRGQFASGDEAHRVLTLALAPDGSAVLTTQYAGTATVIQKGRWLQRSDEVTLTYEPSALAPAVQPIIFRLRGRDLVPAHWNENDWGAAGPPVLRRQRDQGREKDLRSH